MKLIEKSRIETFLKAKGYTPQENEKSKDSANWFKSGNEKVILPQRDIIQSTELSMIFKDNSLLNEFRQY